MKLFDLTFDGQILRRGFWIYVWRIRAPGDQVLIYVGRTGDSSSPHAQSPFNRVSNHCNPAKNSKSNALTRNLQNANIDPESCEFTFLAIGPVLEEAETMEDHLPRRDRMAALERCVADWFRNAGYRVLGAHPRRGNVDESLWRPVEKHLSERFSKDSARTSSRPS